MVAMPITSPSRVTSGPAVAGVDGGVGLHERDAAHARTALTMPRVTELCRTPSGEPTAITSWPLARAPRIQREHLLRCVPG